MKTILLAGLLGYGLLQWIVRKLQGSVGHALGWGFVVAAVASAGIDAWNLFYLGVALILGVVFLDPLLARRQRPAAAGAPEVQHPEMLGTSEAKQMVD